MSDREGPKKYPITNKKQKTPSIIPTKAPVETVSDSWGG